MYYILCYNKPIGHVNFGAKNKVEKKFCFIFQNNGITTLQRHVDASYGQIANKFEEKISNRKCVLIHYRFH